MFHIPASPCPGLRRAVRSAALSIATLTLLAGCYRGDGIADPQDGDPTFPAEQESQVHDIRLDHYAAPYAGVETGVSIVFTTPDREGWSFQWRAGAGQLDASGPEAVWTTPWADSSWIELTLRRCAEEHVCRRWLQLNNPVPHLDLHAAGNLDLPGYAGLRLGVDRPLSADATVQWSSDRGGKQLGGGTRVSWELRTPGPYWIRAELAMGPWRLADSLLVTVPNVAPTFGPWVQEDSGPFPLGGTIQTMIRAGDPNGIRPGLDLPELELEGLQLVDSVWTDAQMPELDYLGGWRLTLRDTVAAPGQRNLLVRLVDGSLFCQQTFPILIE